MAGSESGEHKEVILPNGQTIDLGRLVDFLGGTEHASHFQEYLKALQHIPSGNILRATFFTLLDLLIESIEKNKTLNVTSIQQNIKIIWEMAFAQSKRVGEDATIANAAMDLVELLNSCLIKKGYEDYTGFEFDRKSGVIVPILSESKRSIRKPKSSVYDDDYTETGSFYQRNKVRIWIGFGLLIGGLTGGLGFAFLAAAKGAAAIGIAIYSFLGALGGAVVGGGVATAADTPPSPQSQSALKSSVTSSNRVIPGGLTKKRKAELEGDLSLEDILQELNTEFFKGTLKVEEDSVSILSSQENNKEHLKIINDAIRKMLNTKIDPEKVGIFLGKDQRRYSLPKGKKATDNYFDRETFNETLDSIRATIAEKKPSLTSAPASHPPSP